MDIKVFCKTHGKHSKLVSLSPMSAKSPVFTLDCCKDKRIEVIPE